MSQSMQLLQSIYHRPTPDQALCEAIKDYIREVEPRSTAKVEAICAIAREQAAQEEAQRRGSK